MQTFTPLQQCSIMPGERHTSTELEIRRSTWKRKRPEQCPRSTNCHSIFLRMSMFLLSTSFFILGDTLRHGPCPLVEESLLSNIYIILAKESHISPPRGISWGQGTLSAHVRLMSRLIYIYNFIDLSVQAQIQTMTSVSATRRESVHSGKIWYLKFCKMKPLDDAIDGGHKCRSTVIRCSSTMNLCSADLDESIKGWSEVDSLGPWLIQELLRVCICNKTDKTASACSSPHATRQSQKLLRIHNNLDINFMSGVSWKRKPLRQITITNISEVSLVETLVWKSGVSLYLGRRTSAGLDPRSRSDKIWPAKKWILHSFDMFWALPSGNFGRIDSIDTFQKLSLHICFCSYPQSAQTWQLDPQDWKNHWACSLLERSPKRKSPVV